MASTNTIQTPSLTLEHADPLILYRETDQAANQRMWYVRPVSQVFSIQSLNDDLSGVANVVTWQRGGGQRLYAGTVPGLHIYGRASDSYSVIRFLTNDGGLIAALAVAATNEPV